MAFTQSSSDALQVLNMLLVNKRREDISERQNALTALTFQLREVSAEKDREVKSIGQMQARLKELNQQVKEKRENFKVLSKIPKGNLEFQTDYDGIIGKSLSDVADRFKYYSDEAEFYTNKIQKSENVLRGINEQLNTYSKGLAALTTKLFHEFDLDKEKGILSTEESSKLVDALVEKHKIGINKIAFLEGVEETKREIEDREMLKQKHIADIEYKESLKTQRETPKPKKYNAELELNRIYSDWTKINKILAKSDDADELMQAMGFKGDANKVKPETLYKAFRARVGRYEKKTGEEIMDQFDFQYIQEDDDFDKKFNDIINTLNK